MSPPAKKYPELSGCMTCNTKLTVLKPGPRPACTHAGRGNACCTVVALGRLDGRQERFSSPVNPYALSLMTSRDFICARSSVPADWRARISSLYPALWHVYRTGVIWTRRPLLNDTFSSQTVSQSGWKRTCRVLKALLSKEKDGVGHHAVNSNLTPSVQNTHWHAVQNIKMNSSLFHAMFNHTLVFNSVKYKIAVDGFMQGSKSPQNSCAIFQMSTELHLC